MLERPQSRRQDTIEQPPLVIRRVDAIPVALPLTTPVTMSGITIATADNILVRIEASTAPSAGAKRRPRRP
jgi:hypothetical protein